MLASVNHPRGSASTNSTKKKKRPFKSRALMLRQPRFSSFRFPSLDETQHHPAFAGAKWDLIPDSQGKASVAKDRSGPIDIAWQIHGHGPTKIVVRICFYCTGGIHPSRNEAQHSGWEC